ncbi:MAG: class I SAM-dependent methyltransferase [Deltaproteobacteria bacterium]|nr:class I SAM-dependent methyltransferase [Deltaproteobacteria bacterium]
MRLPVISESIFKKISNLFDMEKNKAESLFSPYFFHYHRGFFSGEWNLQRYLAYFYDVFTKTKAKKARVLDIGCGFGLMSIFFQNFGAAEVIGVDVNDEKITGFKTLLEILGLENGSIKAEFGDTLNIGYSDEEFDVIIANDVLSHVRDLGVFLEEVRRLLRPDGRLYIYDDNNKLFVLNFFERRKFWERCEKGPINDITFRGTDEKLSFSDMRKEMILELEPNCDPSQLKYLVRNTAGMYGDEIKSAVFKFKQTGKIRNQKRFKYRNPKTGEFPERPLSPYVISKALRSKGFFCWALPTFFFVKPIGLKGIIKKGLGLIFRVIPSASFIMAPSFRILCQKSRL